MAALLLGVFALSVFAAGGAWPALAQAGRVPAPALPTLGDAAELSSSAERRLGDRIARELYRDPDYLDDPVLAEYVQAVWQPLLAAARARGDLPADLETRFAWEILLGRDRSVNAFALPGGYFGLHLGLLASVSSADELASVLAHELSHVTQRHIARLIARQDQQAPWVVGAMILGALAASKSADAANALIVGGQAASAQGQLNFSRDMEREADRVGYAVLIEAGFDGQGFAGMFEKLQQAARLNDSGAFPYLRSHPLTTERVADMQNRQILQAARAPRPAPLLQHGLLAARARALSNTGADAQRSLMLEADNSLGAPAPRQAATLYAATLAATRLRDFAAAQAYLARLTPLLDGDPQARQLGLWLSCETSLAADDLPRAARALSAAAAFAPLADRPLRRPELMLQAQVSLQAGAAGSAADLARLAQRLQLWLADHPPDAQAWQLLASAYALQNQGLRALRAEAEARLAQLDLTGALDRLKAAQSRLRQGHSGAGSAEYIEASIIDTRYRQIESRLKEQAQQR